MMRSRTLWISIHALREEGDSRIVWGDERRRGFLSPPSARRATVWWPFAFPPVFISIHALREEGDIAVHGPEDLVDAISIHALREEGDLSRTS